jgi:hypothetical protein
MDDLPKIDSLDKINLGTEIKTKPKRRGRPKKPIKQAPIPHISPVPNIRIKTKELFGSDEEDNAPNSPGDTKILSPIHFEKEEKKEMKDDGKISTENVTEILTKNLFRVIRYIKVGDKLSYVVTYNSDGLPVYIELDDSSVLKSGGHQETEYFKTDYVEYPFNTLEYYEGVLTNEMYGIVLSRGNDMCILKKTDGIDIHKEYFNTGIKDMTMNPDIFDIFPVLKYSDIKSSMDMSTSIIRMTAFAIQQHQIMTLKLNMKTFSDAVDKIKKYKDDMVEKYYTVSDMINKDLKTLGKKGEDFYSLFSNSSMTDEQRTDYNSISANQFLRIQSFNEIPKSILQMKDSWKHMGEVKENLKNFLTYSKKIEEFYEKFVGIEDINISI